MGREEDGEIEAVARALQREERGAGVQEQARALTPHLARLGHELQRAEEHEQRTRRSGGSMGQAASARALVHELDERGPEAAGALVVLHALRVEANGLQQPALLQLRFK